MLKISLLICSLLVSSFSFAKICRKVDAGNEMVKVCADMESLELETKLTNISPAISVERTNGFLSDGPKAVGIKVCEAFGSPIIEFVSTKTTKSNEAALIIIGEQASPIVSKSTKPTKVLKSVDCHWMY